MNNHGHGLHHLSLADYISSNVDDDTLEHLLFTCPCLRDLRDSFNIPSVCSNNNVKLLLGQTNSGHSQWNNIVSFYTSLSRLRPDLIY